MSTGKRFFFDYSLITIITILQDISAAVFGMSLPRFLFCTSQYFHTPLPRISVYTVFLPYQDVLLCHKPTCRTSFSNTSITHTKKQQTHKPAIQKNRTFISPPRSIRSPLSVATTKPPLRPVNSFPTSESPPFSVYQNSRPTSLLSKKSYTYLSSAKYSLTALCIHHQAALAPDETASPHLKTLQFQYTKTADSQACYPKNRTLISPPRSIRSPLSVATTKPPLRPMKQLPHI